MRLLVALHDGDPENGPEEAPDQQRSRKSLTGRRCPRTRTTGNASAVRTGVTFEDMMKYGLKWMLLAAAGILLSAQRSEAQTYVKLNGLYALVGVINPAVEFR